jgi:hypothetical protein
LSAGESTRPSPLNARYWGEFRELILDILAAAEAGSSGPSRNDSADSQKETKETKKEWAPGRPSVLRKAATKLLAL